MSLPEGRLDSRKPKEFKRAECRIDGCTNLVSANNRNRFCDEHLHDPEHCGCFSCRRKRNWAYTKMIKQMGKPSKLELPDWAKI